MVDESENLISDPLYVATSCGVHLFTNLSSDEQRVASEFVDDSDSVVRMHGEHMGRKSRPPLEEDVPSWPPG